MVKTPAVLVALAAPATTEAPAETTSETTETTTDTTTETTAETVDAETGAGAAGAVKIDVLDGEPVGGVHELTLAQGDVARIEVTVDAPQEIHVHGYELEVEATPDKPAKFQFKADLEGIFDVESHAKDELIARLIVEP
jgi:FtsP/CotA-like multicopper oxidase with cupredoxin domain